MSGSFVLVDVIGGVVGVAAVISAIRKLTAERTAAISDKNKASVTIRMPDGKEIEAKMPAREAERLVTYHH